MRVGRGFEGLLKFEVPMDPVGVDFFWLELSYLVLRV